MRMRLPGSALAVAVGLAGLAALALACLGCGEAADGADGAGTPAAPAPPEQAHVHGAHAPPDVEPPPARRPRTFAATECVCDVTSVIFARDGTIWSAGWFRDSVQFGAFTLQSRGEEDAFVAHTAADGTVLWAVSAGSPESERNARVIVQDDGSGGVTLTGLTAGKLDCGSGPLPQWSEATYFLCRYRQTDGMPIDGATFPGPGP
jgi:hypothetical protein